MGAPFACATTQIIARKDFEFAAKEGTFRSMRTRLVDDFFAGRRLLARHLVLALAPILKASTHGRTGRYLTRSQIS
jgi:stress-induced morphogen